MTKITRNQVALEEHARSCNLVQPIAGLTREEALDPETWVHVASIFRPLDKLSVLPIDKKWYGEYIVTVSDGTNFALVETLYRDLVATVGENTGVDVNGYEVCWGGPAHLFRVKRKSDGEVMVSGIATKAEAAAWAANGGKPASAAA